MEVVTLKQNCILMQLDDMETPINVLALNFNMVLTIVQFSTKQIKIPRKFLNMSVEAKYLC